MSIPAHDRSTHWQQVYATKPDGETSWFQEEPKPSFELVCRLAPRCGRVIDVGGGASPLGGLLAAEGFDVTVVDISAAAIERAQARIDGRGQRIHWVVDDVTTLKSIGTFDLWHDRAAFHFLIDAQDRRSYADLAARSVVPGGHLVIATFALAGPERCSGLPVVRYDACGIAAAFKTAFTLTQSFELAHMTPWGKLQEFIFAVLQRTDKNRASDSAR